MCKPDKNVKFTLMLSAGLLAVRFILGWSDAPALNSSVGAAPLGGPHPGRQGKR